MITLYLDKVKVDMPDNWKINMTYQQIDLGSPEAKINNYSKTINVPGTNNNNNLFGHIFRFDTNIQESGSFVGVSFDPNKRIPFILLNNGTLYDRGYAQLDKVNVNNDVITYSITLYGNMGMFFYNLMYNEDGSEKTLNDINWNFVIDSYLDNHGNYVAGHPMSDVEENNNILFEYDKEYLRKAWRYRNLTLDSKELFDNIPENDIYKFVCPVPCYNGFYDDFDSNKVVINTNRLTMNEYYWGDSSQTGGNVLNTYYKQVDGKLYNDFYTYPGSGLLLAELDRDVSEYEINDLRSHYQPYALRLKGIFDAICNPKNNGGFKVNTDNINPIEKKYIENGYIMQDRFSWTDINTTAVNTTKNIVLNKRDLAANNGNDYAISDVYDLTDYLNPNAVVYIYPEVQPQFYTGQSLKTRAAIQGGIRTTQWAWFGYHKTYQKLRGVFGNSVQYFYVNILDENNNLLKTSDIYIYGDYDLNIDDPSDSKNQGLLTTSTDWTFLAGTTHFVAATAWPNAIINLLRSQGKKFARGSIDLQRWPGIPEDLIGNEGEPNVVSLNTSQEGGGYRYNVGGDKSLGPWESYVGDMFKIDLKMPKRKCKIQIVSSALSVTNYVQPSADFGEKWLSNNYEVYPEAQDIYNQFRCYNPGYYTYPEVPDPKGDPRDPNKGNYTGSQYLHEGVSYFKGHIESSSQIFDGATETQDERHTVNKFGLFMNTESPYTYLISLSKMFNWKFEANQFDDEIKIYSNNNYYKNEVVNINDNIDMSNYTIDPTVAESNNYNFNLELVETYPADIWKKTNKADYGKTVFNTGFQFEDEPKEMFDDVIFKNTVPYQQRSVFFNEGASSGGNYQTPSMGKRVTLTLWKTYPNYDKDSTQELTLKGALSAGKVSQNVLSNSLLLGFFDKENAHVDPTNTLVFYDDDLTVDIGGDGNVRSASVQVSDNFPSINSMNGNNCYYWSYISEDTIQTDADNGISGVPAYYEEFPPVFRSYFPDGDTLYFGTMKGEQNEPMYKKYVNRVDLYNLCWKSYISDMYNKNNKIVTIKVKLTDLPIDAMKKFYTFNNAVWVINKITDYNIDDYFTKVEFIQVQNKNNYIGSV